MTCHYNSTLLSDLKLPGIDKIIQSTLTDRQSECQVLHKFTAVDGLVFHKGTTINHLGGVVKIAKEKSDRATCVAAGRKNDLL